MADLNDFFKTDLVDDHASSDINAQIASALYSEFGNTTDISATLELSDIDTPLQILTPTTDLDVELAPEAVTNHVTAIINSSTDYTLTVKDDSSSDTIGTINTDKAGLFISTGAKWYEIGAPTSSDNEFGVGAYGITEGRLTLLSGEPIPTTDVTAATTVYFTPYNGELVSLYTGTKWISYHLDSELSVSVPSTSDTNFDVFLDYNGGTPQLVTTDWTDDTTRATALTTQDGVEVQTGNTDWKYLGTCRTTGTNGQCEDSETKRFVWNKYNRVFRVLFKYDNTGHGYASTTIRYWNNDSTYIIEFVAGKLDEFEMEASFIFEGYASGAGGTAITLPRLDGITTNLIAGAAVKNNNTNAIRASNAFTVQPSVIANAGYHFITLVEFANATGGQFDVAVLSFGFMA